MRDVQMQAESAWRWAQMTSLSSIMGLRQVFAALSRVHGDKTVILISGGWPLDDREETSVLSPLATEAAAARITLYTLFVPGTTFAADRRTMSNSPSRDQYLYSGPLETLAGMTGGGTFRAEVNAEGVFERLGREMGGFYRVGVEKSPTDQDGKSRRMKVQVTRPSVTVRAREIFDARTYEDRDWAARLDAALEGPVPATGIRLRVASYVTPDPEDRSRVKLLLTGDASRLQPGETTVQVVVRDLDGKKVLAGEQPTSDATEDGLQFSTNIPLAPGSYVVRVGVMDSVGQVGSVEHRVDARRVALGDLSGTGPVLVRVPASPSEPRLTIDTVRQDERLAMEVGLEGQMGQIAGTDVIFEVASGADGPALINATGTLTRGSRDGTVLAQAFADMRVLPPGTYVARARVKAGDTPLGELRRFFTVAGAAPPAAAGSGGAVATIIGRRMPGPIAARTVGAVGPFAVDHVLSPQVLGPFLDRVAARPDAASPMIRELVDRARVSVVDLYVSDTLAAESPVAGFLRGLALLSQKKYDHAANAFRGAMRASADFYPAMVYLGACYAAGGKDREAAGAWQTALIREGDAVALHGLLADAQLRQGSGNQALQTVEGARNRWPDDASLKRRFVIAAFLAGKPVEGMAALETLAEPDAAMLALGLMVLYDALTTGQPIESVEQDRARMLRLAETYRARGGPSIALIDTWVAAATRKP